MAEELKHRQTCEKNETRRFQSPVFALLNENADKKAIKENKEHFVHAHWIQKGFDCKRSNCGSLNGAFGVKYCQDCGAKMDEEQK